MVKPLPHPVRIVLSGTFAAISGEGRIVFARRGAERLLAYLALNGAADRPRIAEALWPDASREHGLMNLRQALRAVSSAGGTGWIEASGAALSLDPAVAIDRPGESETGKLLAGWDDAWLEPHRGAATSAPAARAADALFDLLAWHRDRSPQAALGIAIASEPLLSAVTPAQLVGGVAPLLAGVDRLPDDAGEVCTLVARAHYLLGEMDPSFALYGRIVSELGATEAAAHARLSQIVLLRESGATREAARRAEAFAASPPPGGFFRWVARYHQGYARYQAFGRGEDLDAARRAVEADAGEEAPLVRLFPALNVAEALIDEGQIAAGRSLLDEARGLARQADDPLALLTTQMLELNLLAREGSAREALNGLDALEARAGREKLAPFAALVLDRAASLAMGLGRPREAHERLVRSNQLRGGLSVRRTPVERARLASLNTGPAYVR